MRGSLAIQTRRHFLSNFYFTSAEWMTVDEKNSMGGFSFHSWGVLDTQHFSVKMSALVSWLVNRSVFLFFSVPFSVASPSRLRCDTVGQLLTEPIFSLLSGLILQASKNCTKKPKRHSTLLLILLKQEQYMNAKQCSARTNLPDKERSSFNSAKQQKEIKLTGREKDHPRISVMLKTKLWERADVWRTPISSSLVMRTCCLARWDHKL